MVPVAAAFFARAFVDIKESEYDKIVDVDQKGQYFLVQAAARSMIRGGRDGKVVTVASVAYRGEDMPKLAMMTAYNSAKAGVVGMTRGIAKELKQYGINVNCVAPGGMVTPGAIFNNAATAALYGAEWTHYVTEYGSSVPVASNPDEIARMILTMCTPMSDFMYGQLIEVDGGVKQSNAAQVIDAGADVLVMGTGLFRADDPKAVVKTLSVAKQQMVEITKALSHENTRLLILDEPSAVLTDTEIDDLFVFIRQLKKTGVGIIYISHRLDEIFGLCSNVSVLRDGCHIDTIPVASVDRQGLINMMVGREMGQEYPKEVGNVGGTILEVKNLSRGILQDISFEVKSGEVFGISGLVGAGRTELARAILGIDKPESGEVYVRGKKVHYRTFADAIRDGLGLIPEDRKLQGLVQIMSVKRNTTLVNMKRVLRAGVISSSLEEKLSKEYADKLHVVTPSMETEVQYLSGGNQQKVVIAKWLFQNSEILFLDEPTRGIDVGAKAEIYRLINRMAKEGKTIIMISSEMPELLGMCDRIMVMHEGHKMGELNAAEATQEKIMALCS